MEDDVVVTGVAMMLMSEPVAGTDVQFDVAYYGWMEDGVTYVGSLWTTRTAGEDELMAVTVG